MSSSSSQFESEKSIELKRRILEKEKENLSFISETSRLSRENESLRKRISENIEQLNKMKENMKVNDLEISVLKRELFSINEIEEKIKREYERFQIRKQKNVTSHNQCWARVYKAEEHKDKGKPAAKIMRDDEKNLYGSRCLINAKEGERFCSKHTLKQPNGVWDSYYDGQLLKLQNRTELKKEYKREKVIDLDMNETTPGFYEEFQETDNDEISVEDIVIEGINYFIDVQNKIYVEDGTFIGFYDRVQKKLNRLSILSINSKQYLRDTNDNIYSDDGSLIGFYDYTKKEIHML